MKKLTKKMIFLGILLAGLLLAGGLLSAHGAPTFASTGGMTSAAAPVPASYQSPAWVAATAAAVLAAVRVAEYVTEHVKGRDSSSSGSGGMPGNKVLSPGGSYGPTLLDHP